MCVCVCLRACIRACVCVCGCKRIWRHILTVSLLSFRFDLFGIYVVMFLEILKTLLQVLCVFSILLIAFGIAFFMLMNKEVMCNSPPFNGPDSCIKKSIIIIK